VRSVLALCCVSAVCSAEPPPQNRDLVLLSDIHFDPFHDPAKLAQLRTAATISWPAILNAPDSPTQAVDFASLQSKCGAKGVDTPIQLLNSSIAAARAQQPKPLFVTVSGDLMAHQFDCRFHTLAPDATPADYTAFAAKTIDFVALQLWAAFPGVPVYFAFGNNDSGCSDYREDPNSLFLRSGARAVAASTKSRTNRYAILSGFSQLGDYNVALPKPMQHTRLIVLQDLFESKKYAGCHGEPNPPGKTAPAALQVAWLRSQLAAARKAHQHVWIMAHIPPGIDAYSTFTKSRNVCGGDAPETFLGSEAFADTLAEFPDVIRLALFGHTHMDEMRVYASAHGIIPGKLVPSISPVNGNNPAFTVAQVEPNSATLKDYTVYTADNHTGIKTTWAREYTFSSTYGSNDLSGESLQKLVAGFVADKDGSAANSLEYQHFYFASSADAADSGIASATRGGIKAAALHAVWPGYACSLSQDRTAGFHDCMCPVAPPQ
jgi:sphingomyelin phosphodiesterase acid-like 3